MIGPELLLACAPHVAPVTIEKIIEVESSGNPVAIHVNPRKVNGRKIPYQTPIPVHTVQDAVTVAHAAMSQGHSVDLGLMQVNSRNLPALGLTVAEVLEPCTNIRAGADILSAFYERALKIYPKGESALLAALSAYNTGDFEKGFLNGYVAHYRDRTTAHQAIPAVDPRAIDTLIFESRSSESGDTPPPVAEEKAETPPRSVCAASETLIYSADCSISSESAPPGSTVLAEATPQNPGTPAHPSSPEDKHHE